MKWWLPALAFAVVTARAVDVPVPAPAETVTIQAAIDRCSRDGGGRVILPAGRHTTGTILLKNNVTLYLEKDAVLQGSLDIADYQLVEPFVEGTGQRVGWCLIGAVDAKNIGIEGSGTIDGRGRELNAAHSPADRDKRPSLLRFVRGNGVTLKGVHLRSSAMWMVHLARCQKVLITGLTLRNHGAGNNDGFDIDSCEDVRIADCDVDTGDDALCLKSTYPVPCRNVVVENCRLASDCGAIKFGTESLGGFENVRIENCRITRGRLGGIKLFSVDGGTLRNVVITNVVMENVSLPIFIRLGARGKTFHPGDRPRPPGAIRDVTIANVTATGSGSAGVLISGIPGHRVEKVTLKNLDFTLPGGRPSPDGGAFPEKESAYPEIWMFGPVLPASGFVLRHAQEIEIQGSRVRLAAPDARPLRHLEDAVDVTWKD